MIPYFELHTIPLGPIKLQAWGTLVAAGFLLGAWVAARRAKAKKLESGHVWDMAFWILLSAFVGARLFDAVFYDFGRYLADPLAVLDPRQAGYAMWGGLLGAVAALLVYTRAKKLDFWAYSDAAAWGLPWGIMVGRIGCFLIHDHPGKFSNFILAVNYPDGARHDLGLYLALSGLIMGLIFLLLNRKPRGKGFFVGAYFVLEAAARLWLDFYRVADARFAGLTPTQWFAFPLLALGIWLIWKAGQQPVRDIL